jgi:hypothetical protein
MFRIVRFSAIVGLSFLFLDLAFGIESSLPTSFTQVATLTPSDIDAPQALFGQGVAISGNTAVVGAPLANNGAGAAYVFVEPATGWGNMTQTAELSASDSYAGLYFGGTVSISGNTIVVGSSAHNTAYVFTKPKAGWTNMTETARLSAAKNTNGIADQFGANVAINGATIAVAAYQASFARGRVDVFTEPKSGWVNAQPTGHLFAPDPKVNGFFGESLAVQGTTIVVGALGDGVEGEAYVFVEPSSGWKGSHTQAAILTASNATSSNFFGEVAVNGSTIVVGAFGLNNNTGAVYIFQKPSSGWVSMTQTAELTASNGLSSDLLGVSVAMIGTTVIAGASSNGNAGAVYTFDEPAGGWVNGTQTSELSVSGTVDFGIAAGASGQTFIAGEPYGAAFIFVEQ